MIYNIWVVILRQFKLTVLGKPSLYYSKVNDTEYNEDGPYKEKEFAV